MLQKGNATPNLIEKGFPRDDINDAIMLQIKFERTANRFLNFLENEDDQV